MTDVAKLFAELTLLRPWWLLALLPLGILLWHLARHRTPEHGNWEGVVDPALLPHVAIPRLPDRHRSTRIATTVGLMLAVLALAGPAVPGKNAIALRSDAVRVLLVGLSPPAAELDAPATDEAMRIALLELLGQLPDGQTALVVYGEEPYLAAPPTTDAATLRLLVPELSPGLLPLAGDRPERALRLAQKTLSKSGADGRDVVWFTSHTVASAEALEVLEALHRDGVRVSLLHTGPTDNGSAAASPLTDSIRATGGRYVALADASAAASLIATDLATGHGTRATRAHAATPQELGPWLLPLILPLAALAFRRGLLILLAVAVVCPFSSADAMDLTGWRRRPDQRAPLVLQDGDAAAAARQFADPRWKAVAYYRAGRYAEAASLLEPFDDADSLYNRGNALAHEERLQEALQAFETALRQRPNDPDIRHNRDVVQRLIPPPPPPAAGGGKGKAPPPPPAPSAAEQNAARSDHEQEAQRLAEQWLRRVPDEPAGLLRRKLELEHRRRQSGEVSRPW
ncbi:tetratricopeptide repeat protein [Azoarcus sp. KH32C]|uniref:vWA domain-containing protein n=1 Tax=Azoarcus sp. KH32C TaxID=748247 RepID=UPI0002386AEC|nr:tetratricopeptide repeat protein [Azoarcus sp. KH32C]BAL22712.1 hypothetical protein AZKH_0366 [Azoarcus sp. KH32C]